MRKATGSYLNYSILSKTAALIPEFVVEDLPSVELQSILFETVFYILNKVVIHYGKFRKILKLEK